MVLKMKKKQLLSVVALSAFLVITLAACTNKQETKHTGVESSTSEVAKETPKESVTSNSQAEASPSINLSELTPLAEVIRQYEETYPDADITKIELKDSFSSLYYIVEGVNDTTEFELRINAKTNEAKKGQEEKLDKEDQNGQKRQNDALDLSNLAPLEEIIEAAQEKVKGGEVTELELERELSTTYWTVTVKEGFQESNVKIDAKTKEVLEVELED